MLESTRVSFHLWDEQELARVQEMRKQLQQAAYIELNNLYLSVERGETPMSITVSNQLRTLVGRAYDQDDDMSRNYWNRELQALPNWNEF